MGTILAGAVKAAAKPVATKAVGKTAARVATKTAIGTAAPRQAASASARRMAAQKYVQQSGQRALDRAPEAAMLASASKADGLLSETFGVLGHGLATVALGSMVLVLGVGTIGMAAYDRATDSGIGFAPWLWGVMGFQIPGLGFSLPGLPSFDFGGDASQGQEIADAALAYTGKEFKPGVLAQCAVFVRAVLADAGVDVGVTESPIDGKYTGPAFANSFYGNDLGQIIKDKSALRPGDIVMFFNTYGNWKPGTVTHVGVYVGEGMMVDRPTASRPVQHRSIDTFEFAGALRIPGSQIKGDTDASPHSIYKGLKRRGMSPLMAAAFVGNIGQESGFDPAVVNSIGAFGLVQWLDGRRSRLEAFAAQHGKPASDVDVQLDFIKHELYGNESAAYSAIKAAEATGSLEATVEAIAVHYERMAPHETMLHNRVRYAREVYGK